ncbi:MAG: hypothetical protein ACREUL_05340 [Steroidobacteraceae bacterium]
MAAYNAFTNGVKPISATEVKPNWPYYSELHVDRYAPALSHTPSHH